MDNLRKTIEALNQAMTDAFKRGDIRGVAQFYADDGMVIGPYGQRFQGRDAIASYWESFTTAKDWHLEMLEFDGDSNIVYQVARSKITHDFDEGDEFTGIVDVVLIWKRQSDNTYRIYVDTYM